MTFIARWLTAVQHPERLRSMAEGISLPKTSKSRWARFRRYFKKRSTYSEESEPGLQPGATCIADPIPSDPIDLHESSDEPAILVNNAAVGPQRSQLADRDHDPTQRKPFIDYEVSQQICTDSHLAEIATSIVKWRELSPFLGLTEAEEHEILGSAPHSVLQQKIALLRLWKKKTGRAATYNRLCQVFRNSERLDLEDKIKQILTESTCSSLIDKGELFANTCTFFIST